MLKENRSFWKALLFTIMTLGIYNLSLIHAFAKETNIACADDGKKTRGLLLYIIFNILTFGIYSLVWHCNWINRRNSYLTQNHKPEGLQLSTYLLTYFLFGPFTIGIMSVVVYCKKLYLQNAVNRTFNEASVC